MKGVCKATLIFLLQKLQMTGGSGVHTCHDDGLNERWKKEKIIIPRTICTILSRYPRRIVQVEFDFHDPKSNLVSYMPMKPG